MTVSPDQLADAVLGDDPRLRSIVRHLHRFAPWPRIAQAATLREAMHLVVLDISRAMVHRVVSLEHRGHYLDEETEAVHSGCTTTLIPGTFARAIRPGTTDALHSASAGPLENPRIDRDEAHFRTFAGTRVRTFVGQSQPSPNSGLQRQTGDRAP